MSAVMVLVLIAGLSEATGRVLPLVSRRPGMSRPVVVGLLLSGTLVEAAVIAFWPRVAWAVAELVASGPTPDATGPAWTPALVAPLVLAGVLSFPWLGPLLHLVLLVAVGAGLTGPLATASGLGWAVAAGCVTVAALGLACAVDVVRRLVARLLAIGVVEAGA
ncbi:hypothetical protein [Kribbella sp. HUAS MG21]|uniref:Integral membrane protein n=1 Tax=Kribbella sp. HUAS MG21 TaxID=3160966 RepID=A0AAU7TEF9_9ACTN